MFKKLAILSLFVTTTALADPPQELYLPNDAGGYITLTLDDCKLPNGAKQGYHFRAYATEDEEGKVKHEGCWVRPDTSEAPRIQGVKIIPLVNTLWETGDVVTFQASQFGPDKKRWDIRAPEVVVKPNT